MTGTVRLKAVFDNEDGVLFPNQFVNARLLVDTKRDAIVVPNAAVQRGPNNTFVYVVQADDTVELRTVKPGMVEGAETAIESGLTAGEIVVTEGIDKLQPKTQVTTREKEKEKEKEKERSSGQEPSKKPESEGTSKPKNETASAPGGKGST
jgi:multidrug efflux system membrane fusion protein